MTKDEALDALRALSENYDSEHGHFQADDILCEFLKYLGHEDVVELYDSLQPKWYA